MLVAQSCLTLSDPMDCSPPGSFPEENSWNSPGKLTGVGSHSFLQRIFLTQGSNLGLLHCRRILYHLSHQEIRSLQISSGSDEVTLKWLSGKECACKCRRHKFVGLIPGLRRSPRGGHGNSLQYSCLGNHIDRRAWWATVHRVTKSWTQLKQLSKAPLPE